ncbi:unnamed protein product [Hyaloperonospora brassicae]|uniref:Uncharacterized protein n=1 Tax=Hyaloperonospora brassicae TaxID=162125 RepID=A0AAV0TZY9_HYABA|nr:unnamed protein product [Hyaloperonospora brassicae]
MWVDAHCAKVTSLRWGLAVKNKGCPAIWFGPELDYQPSRLECLVSPPGGDAEGMQVPELALECNLDSLLRLLPASYRTAILAPDNARDLVDICIDAGRVPIAYTGRKQRVQLCPDGSVVPKSVIDETPTDLGGEERTGSDTIEPALMVNCTALMVECTASPSRAKAAATQAKVQTQQSGGPMFDGIVELDAVVRGRCGVVWDVAHAVDRVLAGAMGDGAAETRQ